VDGLGARDRDHDLHPPSEGGDRELPHRAPGGGGHEHPAHPSRVEDVRPLDEDVPPTKLPERLVRGELDRLAAAEDEGRRLPLRGERGERVSDVPRAEPLPLDPPAEELLSHVAVRRPEGHDDKPLPEGALYRRELRHPPRDEPPRRPWRQDNDRPISGCVPIPVHAITLANDAIFGKGVIGWSSHARSTSASGGGSGGTSPWGTRSPGRWTGMPAPTRTRRASCGNRRRAIGGR